MNSYPNPGDPNQANQYPPGQGQPGTPYGAPSTGYGDQPPYQQQQAFQQPPYQQPPYGQSPYAQSPYAQSTIAFDWRYLTAAGGALLSFIAFFLPYRTSVYFGIVAASYSGLQLGQQVLLDLIIALAAIATALLLQFNTQLFKAPTSPMLQKLANSLNTNQRTWGLALLSIGAFGIFFRFILDLGVLSTWGIGSWLYLIGMIAVTVGGFFVYRPPNTTPTQTPMR